jgi:Rrf2 family protein
MLKLSKKAEYAFMAARYMALNNSSRYSTAKEISDSYTIPYPLVAKVLQSLARNEIAISAKGANGGFILAKNPGMISLVDIILAVETDYAITNCMKEEATVDDCSHFDCCKIRDPLVELQKKIDKIFLETSLEEIL